MDAWLARELRHPGSTQKAKLRSLPPLVTDGLRPAQITAIQNLEVSLAEGRPRALIQMALYRLGVPDKVIQASLRHSNVNVTLAYYVKSASSDVLEAMGRFEQELTVQTVQDTD